MPFIPISNRTSRVLHVGIEPEGTVCAKLSSCLVVKRIVRSVDRFA